DGVGDTDHRAMRVPRIHPRIGDVVGEVIADEEQRVPLIEGNAPIRTRGEANGLRQFATDIEVLVPVRFGTDEQARRRGRGPPVEGDCRSVADERTFVVASVDTGIQTGGEIEGEAVAKVGVVATLDAGE